MKKSKNEEGGEIRGIEKKTRRRIEEKTEAKGNLVKWKEGERRG